MFEHLGPNLSIRVEMTLFPGPSALVAPTEDRETSPLLSSLPQQRLRSLLQSPAGQAVFEQISAVVQGRLEYLTSQNPNLTTRMGGWPDLSVPLDSKADLTGWRTEDPTHQLRETVSVTFQLLDELCNISQVKPDAAIMADKMSRLSLNLTKLGLWDVAFEVQTTVIVLCRTPQDMQGLATSLAELSKALFRPDPREEGLRRIEEAVRLYLPLVADRPSAFRPHLASSLTTLRLSF